MGSHGRRLPLAFAKEPVFEPTTVPPARSEIISLHGIYFFTPSELTQDDLQQFLWSGLRVLRAEAKARGMSDEQVHKLLLSAFDVFHDAAESMWTALKSVVSVPELRRSPGTKRLAASDSFVACEEDRPIPVEMGYREPLRRLDPDAAILASEE